MTTDHKAGKECPNCAKGYVWSPQKHWQKCPDCHGLRWLPQPGDALTAGEAKILFRHTKAVRVSRKSAMFIVFSPYLGPEGFDFVKAEKEGYKFRLAPAPETKHEEGESVEEMIDDMVHGKNLDATASGWMRCGAIVMANRLLSLNRKQFDDLKRKTV